MFEASRLHSLSEAGAHKPFFSSLVPLFAVEAVSRPVQWKGYGVLRPYLTFLLWVIFPWFLGFRCECAGFVEA